MASDYLCKIKIGEKTMDVWLPIVPRRSDTLYSETIASTEQIASEQMNERYMVSKTSMRRNEEGFYYEIEVL